MVRINDMARFAMGILFAFFNVYIIVLGYPISFFNIFFILAGLFLILNSILEHKTATLHITFGSMLLISTFIAIMNLNTPLLSKEVFVGIILGVIFLILGIMIHLGYLSEDF